MYGGISNEDLLFEGDYCVPVTVWMLWMQEAARKRAHFLAKGMYDAAEQAAAAAEEYKRRIERLTADPTFR